MSVERMVARQVCGVLARDGQIDQSTGRSRVSAAVFRLFLPGVEGESIELTNENVDGLSTLCDEFGFWSISRRVKRFKTTSMYRLEKRFTEIEEWIEGVIGRVALLEAEVTALRSTGETVTAPMLTRLEGEVKIVMDSTAPVRSDVTLIKGRMNDFTVVFLARKPP
jgi:hypothetical protein